MLYFCRFTWFCFFAVLIGYSIYAYPKLPETINIHFDVKGDVDGVGSKQNFFIFISIGIFLLNNLFFMLSLFIKKIPISALSIPWKNYWFLNDERQKKAYQKLETILALSGTYINGVLFFVVFIVSYSSKKPYVQCSGADFLQGNSLWIIFGGLLVLLTCIFLLLKPKQNNTLESKGTN